MTKSWLTEKDEKKHTKMSFGHGNMRGLDYCSSFFLHFWFFSNLFCNMNTVFFLLMFLICSSRKRKMAESQCKMPLIAKPILPSKKRKACILKLIKHKYLQP